MNTLSKNFRANIQDLEKALSEYPQLSIEPKHYFSEGLYAREILIPKGSVCTGKIHKHSHINIISQGHISIATEDLHIRVKAPYTFVSPPGTKKAVIAHEDTVWTTIHFCHDAKYGDEVHQEALEKEFIVQSYDLLESGEI